MSVSPEDKQDALHRVLASAEFAQSPRMAQMLRFLVEHPAEESLKETVIGVGVFGREPTYDPKLDPVVRVEARRLRTKLLEYYDGAGKGDPVRIELPKGTYRPSFSRPEATPAPAAPAAPAAAVSRGLIAAGVLPFVAVGAIWWFARQTPEPAVASAPRIVTESQFSSRAPAFSPDGQAILFSRDEPDGSSHIYRLELSQREPKLVTAGAVRDFEPAWAADGTMAWQRETLPGQGVILMAGKREITRLAVRGSMSFTPDSQYILAPDRDGGSGPIHIARVRLSDGRKERLTQPPTGTQGDLFPRVSPDGREAAFVRLAESAVQDVHVMDLTPGAPARRLTNEKAVFEGLDYGEDGRELLAAFARVNTARSLYRVDRASGKVSRVPEAGLLPLAPVVARKGRRLAFTLRISDTNLWRAELPAGANPRALTQALQLDTGPQISPDGKRVVFRSNRGGSDDVWIANGDGTEARRLTAMNGSVTGSARWSPDGSRIVFDSRPAGNGDLLVMDTRNETAPPRQLTRESSNEVLPSWSRDSEWIYFSSDRTGEWEVFRMRAATPEAPAERMTSAGGFAPFEGYDGKLYYVKRTGEGRIWRMSLATRLEEKLAPLPPNLWGQWALSRTGLFYAAWPQDRVIRRLDLATGATRDVLPLRKLPVQFDSGMSVAPDEAWICWSQLDASGSDIYVIDNFQ